MQRELALTVFRGRAGDRNPRGMAGAALLGTARATRTGSPPIFVGSPAAPLAQGWDVEREAARPELRELMNR